MKQLFEKLYQQKNLAEGEMKQVAQAMFSGQLRESQISAFLIALKLKGVTSYEMTALAQVLQQAALKIDNTPVTAMDNCGTGGDNLQTFNISTTAAFVLAAGGIPMAKHGNRSISSRSGSADVLEALGVKLALSKQALSYLLNEIGIAFLFAPAMHKNMCYVSKIRQELATPTILNLIGPLTNPVTLQTQLMGTCAGDLIKETCETLMHLGRKRAIVLHGFGGMDEANLSGDTQYALFDGENVTQHVVSSKELGLPTYEIAAISGGDAKENSEILLSVLQNKTSPYLDTVILNAAFGFYANGKVLSLTKGIEYARSIIASGAAYDKLQQLIKLQEVA